MTGYNEEGIIPLDLRRLSPVDLKADIWSDWVLSTLLQHNGYELVGLELINAVDGESTYLRNGHCIPGWHYSLSLYGMCIDDNARMYKFNVFARNDTSSKDFLWINKRYIGEDEDVDMTDGRYHIEDAVLRFSRRGDGLLKQPKWVEVLEGGERFSPSGDKIPYDCYDDGTLHRKFYYQYEDDDYCEEEITDDDWWRLTMGLPPDRDELFDIDND